MVRMRLRRVGFKNQSSYRIVIADKEKSRDGRFLEVMGFYNPRTQPATIEINEERVFDWLQKGAQPSNSVQQIFRTVGLMDRFEKVKSGDPIEKVLEEARAYYDARKVNPKTRLDARE